ncbi:hypothetical protein PAPYR_4253 [Paratrimastix pyriformis]|uniref:Uncharacterized protein n=1 Tax=Paratrimastix pyriformis TaxID=342808 RepID=A0ABQ8UQ56_9EUKA|nr:hypothetical protein PAPYR_4253 [Paratrimastix pyriformis]
MGVYVRKPTHKQPKKIRSLCLWTCRQAYQLPAGPPLHALDDLPRGDLPVQLVHPSSRQAIRKAMRPAEGRASAGLRQAGAAAGQLGRVAAPQLLKSKKYSVPSWTTAASVRPVVGGGGGW